MGEHTRACKRFYLLTIEFNSAQLSLGYMQLELGIARQSTVKLSHQIDLERVQILQARARVTKIMRFVAIQRLLTLRWVILKRNRNNIYLQTLLKKQLFLTQALHRRQRANYRNIFTVKLISIRVKWFLFEGICGC